MIMVERHLFPSDTVTRPANTTTYGSGDLVANSATAGSVTPLSFTQSSIAHGGTGVIKRVRLSNDSETVANSDFRVHIFTSDPTATAPANGDNGAFSVTAVGGWIGAFDVTIDQPFVVGATGIDSSNHGDGVYFKCAANTVTLYGLIEARAAYVPESGETFTVTLEIAAD